MNFKLEPIQYILFLILIKFSIVMIVSAMLSNFNYFFDKFFSISKNLKTKLILSYIIIPTIIIGLLLRYTANYHALDYAVPFLYLIGSVLGFIPSLISSIIVSFFISIFSSEYYYALFCIISSIIGSFFYKEDFFQDKKNKYLAYYGLIPLILISIILHLYVPVNFFFTLSNKTIEGNIVAILSDAVSVFLVYFVFEYHYKSIKLMENSYNLNEARLAILSSQINPHFLFNTLNTIASAIRLKPNIARDIVFKLSEILRYVLKTENDFKPLQDELTFIENYLSIENIRFGEQRLNYKFDIEENCREFLIPTMILQPIVENAIKHGLSSVAKKKGILTIKAKFNNNALEISICDNGKGINNLDNNIYKKGIGLSNIKARLNLLFGNLSNINIISSIDEGTTVCLIIPKRVI